MLIDAQGFIDGIGPMASLPRPLAAAGVWVLRTEQLRMAANKMAYHDQASDLIIIHIAHNRTCAEPPCMRAALCMCGRLRMRQARQAAPSAAPGGVQAGVLS